MGSKISLRKAPIGIRDKTFVPPVTRRIRTYALLSDVISGGGSVNFWEFLHLALFCDKALTG